MADIKFGAKNLTGINKLKIPLSDGSGTALYVYDDNPLADKPETMGQRACLANAAQMRDVTYTLRGTLPVIGGTYPAGRVVTGLPYSSVRKTDRFVGYNISLYTFLTAINNPRSLLYTTTAADNTADNGSIANTYYGTNCSTFASYCHGWDYHSATNTIPELPYITEIAPEDIKLCDLPVASLDHGGTTGHATMVTAITRNEDGTIDTLEISESTGPVIRAVTMTYDEFITNYIDEQGYKVYRDSKLYGASYKASPFVQVFEDEPSVDFVYSNLCTNRGDKVTITSDEEIKLNVLIDSGYEGIKLLKDGVDYAEYTVSGGDIVNGDVTLTELTAGLYTAVLYDSSGKAVDNAYTSFEVVEVFAEQDGNRILFGGIGGVPARVVYKNSGGYTLAVFDLTEDDIARGYKEITGYTGIPPAQVCVPFKTIYGFAVARLDYSDTPASAIPAEYQQVTYIETSGGQYIDTGVKASEYSDGIAYRMNCNITGLANASGTNYLFGANANNSRSGNIGINTSGQLIFICGGNGNALKMASLTYGTDITLEVTATSADVNNSVVTLNGSLFNRQADGVNSAMPNVNIYLLAVNGVDTSRSFKGKLYGFKMDAADGTPIRNFVPCYRVSDGVIGLYDTVGGTFYTNSGTGSFTKGADVA